MPITKGGWMGLGAAFRPVDHLLLQWKTGNVKELLKDFTPIPFTFDQE